MATVTKSIKASGGDYSSIASWEADLDTTPDPYNSGDDAIGECYDEVYSEHVSITHGATVGLNSITLRAAADEGHDGTAGTGARIVATGTTNLLTTNVDVDVSLCYLELNGNGNAIQYLNAATAQDLSTLRGLIVHNVARYGTTGGISSGVWNASKRNVLNCFVWNLQQQGAGLTTGIIQYGHNSHYGYIANCSVYNITHTGSGTANGVSNPDYNNNHVRNTIVIGSTTADFSVEPTNDQDYVISSDTTASGTNVVENAIAADNFTSTSPVDLHIPDTDADSYQFAEDLGTSPAGVQYDIDQESGSVNGRDRDTQGDTWDCGADQYVAGSGEQSVTCSVASATATGVDTSVTLGQISRTCTVAAATATAVDTSADQTLSVTCSVAAAIASAAPASVELGEITRTCTAASADAVAVDASNELQGGPQSVTCSVAAASASCAPASVELGEITRTCTVAAADATGVQTSVTLGEITRTCTVAIATAEGVPLSIELGEITRTCTAASADAVGAPCTNFTGIGVRCTVASATASCAPASVELGEISRTCTAASADAIGVDASNAMSGVGYSPNPVFLMGV